MKLPKTIALAATATLPLTLALALSACGGVGGTRDTIRAVGSSTVYPFAKLVAENFARSNPQFRSPLIESTGTGGGIALFCGGLGPSTPDLANASRRMKESEFETCQANGVADVLEIQVGLDGIAFATTKGGIDLKLTPEIIYEALAANPYGQPQTAQTWSDVDPSLPDKPILVYGPPSTSGTRDALKELILEKGCDTDPAMGRLEERDKDDYTRICTEVRTDGKYVEVGEQDNLIVQKIEGNRDAMGIFGYSYLEENQDRLTGLTMNGVEPTYANISDFSYPGARPLFVYAKTAHVGAIPGLKEYLASWPRQWGPGGPLAKIGLVASPDSVARANARKATTLQPLLTKTALATPLNER